MFGKLDILTALIAILGVGALTVGVTVASSTPIVPTPMTNSGNSGNSNAQPVQPIHGQVNVCNRSPMMAAWLVSRTGATSCATLGHYALGDILGTVDLDERMIATLQDGDFAGLWNINNIDLSENSLTAFDSSWIALEDGFEYHGLAFIDLSDNSIAAVSNSDFSALLNAGFRTIDFSDNDITAFPHASEYEGPTTIRAPSQHPTLHRIDFADNNIMAKGPDGVFGLVDVAEIDVSGNSSLCWDDAADVASWLFGTRLGYSSLNLRVLDLGGTQSSGSTPINFHNLIAASHSSERNNLPLLTLSGYTPPTPRGSTCPGETPPPAPPADPTGSITSIAVTPCDTGLDVTITATSDFVPGLLQLFIDPHPGHGVTFNRSRDGSITRADGDDPGITVPEFTAASAQIRGVDPSATDYYITVQNVTSSGSHAHFTQSLHSGYTAGTTCP